jgi:hypothetical protein
MIDVYKYYTRTFKIPVKLRHLYSNNDCLKCHAGAARWLAQHGDFKEQIFSVELPCMACHADKNPPHGSTIRTVSYASKRIDFDSRLSRRLLIFAQILALLALGLGLHFLWNTTMESSVQRSSLADPTAACRADCDG